MEGENNWTPCGTTIRCSVVLYPSSQSPELLELQTPRDVVEAGIPTAFRLLAFNCTFALAPLCHYAVAPDALCFGYMVASDRRSQQLCSYIQEGIYDGLIKQMSNCKEVPYTYSPHVYTQTHTVKP